MAVSRRSKGVTLFALSIIIFSVLRLAGTKSIYLSFHMLTKGALGVVIFYSIVNNIALIAAGINLMKLKEWARETVVILTGVGIVYMLVISTPLAFKSVDLIPDSPRYSAQIARSFASLPAETLVDKNITEASYTKALLKVIRITYKIGTTISAIYLLSIIFFLTRPRVMAQFKASEETEKSS